MTDNSQLLIFTDLDGSLLDHYNYSHQAADAMLEHLESINTPVIPTSSKTKEELLHIRLSLKNVHPFIIENGAAVFIPIGYFEAQPFGTSENGQFWVKEFVHPRHYWQSLITHVSTIGNENFTTFSELTTQQIASLTGLEIDAASRASHRLFGEPVHWSGTDEEKQRFIDELIGMGATVLQGGRFIHVSGDINKGKAMLWLIEQYKKLNNETTIKSLAIGDSPNDIAMLETADIALLIRSPSHDFPKLDRHQNTYLLESHGPKGWAQGVSGILQTHFIFSQQG